LNPRSKYYEVFGLTDKATKQEVRRAYRKLAMRFHPDKNPDPKAHKLFIDLTEAYQILIDDKPLPQQQQIPKPKRQKTEEQRIREAQMRLKKQHYRNYMEQEYYFRKLTSGKRWSIFRIFSWVSAALAFILLIEPVLPRHFEDHSVVAYCNTYGGLQYSSVQCMQTDRGLSLFVEDPGGRIISMQPEITIERSWFLHNPVKVWLGKFGHKQSYHVDFSVINLFPIVPMLFLLPALTMWYKKKTYLFSLGYFFSQYIVGAFVIFVLFTQDRWAHILTLGFL